MLILIFHFKIGKWSNPSIIGQCIIWPASFFIIEKINNTSAVVFGGGDSEDEDNISNNIYILEISISTVVRASKCNIAHDYTKF